MSGDPEQEYFADGISEDIITGLSKLRWLHVIARNSTFAYKDKTVDVKRTARELGVRHALEGSVRKGGNRVRVTVQLIDATTGNHIWADRYDGELTGAFELQDEVTRKIISIVEPKLLEAEGIRSQSRATEDLGAWEIVAQANALFWRVTKAEGEAAIAILRKAVERYPNYGPAHSMLAFSMLVSRLIGWTLVAPQLKEAAALAARASELDGSDPWAHLALGYVAHMERRTEDAKLEYRRAIDLNPNFAAAYGYLGFTLAMAGQSDEAITQLERAISFARKAVQERDGITSGHRIYIASFAQAGQIGEARLALPHLREMMPNISIAWCEQHVPYAPAPMAKFLDGMRKAGPE
jgi:adenylate cyclase